MPTEEQITSNAPLRVVALSETDAQIETLAEGAIYRRIEPIILDAPDWVLRDVLAQHDAEPVQTPAIRVARIRNATVFYQGLVRVASGELVGESTWRALPFIGPSGFTAAKDSDSVIPTCDLTPESRVSSEPHVLLTRLWDGNYGHWLIEVLPLIAHVARVEDLAACRFIIPAWPGMRQVYVDSLALWGIPPDRLVLAGAQSLFVENLIYPVPTTESPWMIGPSPVQTLAYLRDRVFAYAAVTPGPTKLFVSRNRFTKRHLINEDAVLCMATRLGYELVHPEALSFFEQAAKFSNASHVIGNLGAALTNLAYAPPGVRLLALTTEHMRDDFYWDLITQKQGKYISLHGHAASPEEGMQSDFEINLDRFMEVLAQVEAG